MNPRGAHAAAGARADILALVIPVVERVRSTIEAENQELARDRVIDYQAHSQRKSQGLLELNRLLGALSHVHDHPDARAALAALSTELDVNRGLLEIQLRAARTVSSIVARAVREGQSDGTYSAYAWRDNEG